MATAPELFELQPGGWRESEHVRTLTISPDGGCANENYLFTAIYDLIILTPDRAEIIDWKTYPKPKYKKDLTNECQTRLYLYLLAETSDYLPKQITFTYWFIDSNPQPKSVRICYTLKQHRQTHQDLLTQVSKLTEYLDAANSRREQFPQVAASTGLCQECNFAPRCGREGQDSSSLPIFVNGEIDLIPLIAI